MIEQQNRTRTDNLQQKSSTESDYQQFCTFDEVSPDLQNFAAKPPSSKIKLEKKSKKSTTSNGSKKKKKKARKKIKVKKEKIDPQPIATVNNLSPKSFVSNPKPESCDFFPQYDSSNLPKAEPEEKSTDASRSWKSDEDFDVKSEMKPKR